MALHAADVLFKVAVIEEFGKGQLLEAGDGAAVKPQLFPILRHETLGQDHIADTQSRCDGAGEGVQVDDAAHGIHAVHGGHHAAGKAEFRVVVVLDDPAVAAGHPRHQLPPPDDGHDDACGVLVTGGDVQDIHVGA